VIADPGTCPDPGWSPNLFRDAVEGMRGAAPDAKFITAQLKSGLPVPMLHLFGKPAVPYVTEDAGHMLGPDHYRDRNRDGTANASGYPKWPFSNGTAHPGDDYYTVGGANRDYVDHYVMITEYYEDGFDGKKKLVVASWGGKLVIELKDAHIGNLGGVFKLRGPGSGGGF
jgi:hypothetical protein